ncbi:MAG: glycosyl hydrolase family 28 protein [Lachnospiraceae bacterium]
MNPKDSPNTDGLDPESCKDVEIAGVYFSLGDDCIAVKSGKIYMGSKYKRPCEDITSASAVCGMDTALLRSEARWRAE